MWSESYVGDKMGGHEVCSAAIEPYWRAAKRPAPGEAAALRPACAQYVGKWWRTSVTDINGNAKDENVLFVPMGRAMRFHSE